MKHYAPHRWVDFVGSRVQGMQGIAMPAHVLGCEGCHRIADVLGRLTATATAELHHEPPPEVVRRAKALYTKLNPQHEGRGSLLRARLVLDRLRDLVPAGVRGVSGLPANALSSPRRTRRRGGSTTSTDAHVEFESRLQAQQAQGNQQAPAVLEGGKGSCCGGPRRPLRLP